MLIHRNKSEMESFRTARADPRSDAAQAMDTALSRAVTDAMHKPTEPKPFRCRCNGPRAHIRGVNSVGVPQMVCPDCVARIDRDADEAEAMDETPVVSLGQGEYRKDYYGKDL